MNKDWGSITKTIRKLSFLFFQQYSDPFLKQNLTAMKNSILVAVILSVLSSIAIVYFIDSKIEDDLIYKYTLSFRISHIVISVVSFLLFVFRWDSKIIHSTYLITFLVVVLLASVYPLLLIDPERLSFHMLSSSFILLASALLIWIEPIKILILTVFYLSMFLPVYTDQAEKNTSSMNSIEMIILIIIVSVIGITGSILLNYWRFEEFRSIRRNKKIHETLKIANHKMNELSMLDSLTELYNRRYLLEQFDLFKKKAMREGLQVGLIILDLDHLKKINDLYGHKQGDIAIKAFANILKSRVRAADIAARIGGDEFCIMASPIDRIGLNSLMESIKDKLETLEIPYHANKFQTLKLSASLGATLYSPKDEYSFDTLYHYIDQALYRSKNEGRNRITFVDSSFIR